MSKFLLTISKNNKVINTDTFKKEFNRYSDKNIDLLFKKNDPRFTKSFTESIFVFSFSKVENFNELKEEFGLKNVNTDADLITGLYRAHRTDLFNYLKGSFSLIIYDNLTGEILAGSDHHGFLPLYFYQDKKSITFTSTPKFLFQESLLKKELDQEILLDYLVSGLPRKNRTIYKNVNHICGNSYITTSKKFEKYKIEKYFSFKSKPSFSKNIINETKDIFLKTISSKLHKTDKKIACMLSGGLDSSSIVCSIDHLNKKNKLNKKLEIYSAVFPNLSLEERRRADESFYIDDVLLKTDCESVKKSFDEFGPIKILDELTDLDEPAVAPNLYINFTILKELKKKDIKILFDGSGGDSTIGHGHARFLELGRRFQFIQLINEYKHFSSLRSQTISLFNLIKKFILKPLIPFKLQKRKLLATKDKLDYFNLNLFLKDEVQINSYDRFYDIHGYYPFIDLPNNPNIYRYEEASANSLFAQYASRLSFHIGKKFDVEIITPYYDKNFMEYCLNVPMKEKMKLGRDRSYFRDAMKGIVPDSILQRTDKGDLSPVFRNEFNSIPNHKILDLILSDQNSYLYKVIDKNKLISFIDIHKKNPKQENANILYKLVYMSQWVKKNF